MNFEQTKNLQPDQKLMIAAFSVATIAGTLNERNIAVYSDRNHPARAESGKLPAGLIYLEADTNNRRIHVAAIDPLTDLADRVLAGFMMDNGMPIVREYNPTQTPAIDPNPDFPPGKKNRRPAYFNDWEKRLWTLYYVVFMMPNPFGSHQLPLTKFFEDYRI